MTGLRVELTRLRWRRAVLLLLVGAVVLPALLFAGTAWNTRPMSEAEVERVLADAALESLRTGRTVPVPA